METARGIWRAAATACAVVALAMTALTVSAPSLARALAREDGPIEWAQVALVLLGLGFVVAAAGAGFRPGDVVLAAPLVCLAWAELDLDRRLLGISVIDWAFVTSASVPLAHRLLVPAVLTAAGLALVAYASLHRAALIAEMREGWRQAWAGPLLAGVLLFAIPQPCERCVDRFFGSPRWVAEETLELLGMLCATFALARRRAERLRPHFAEDTR